MGATLSIHCIVDGYILALPRLARWGIWRQSSRMDESELDAICARLTKRVAREAAMGLGQRWRCPSGLRGEIVAYAVTCRETGEALAPVSERLGLVESTLARWLRWVPRSPLHHC